MTADTATCGAVQPNPSTHGDTHTHECHLTGGHDDPGPGGGVPRPAHRCRCGTEWSTQLLADGRDATLIRFPSTGPGAPQVDLRPAGRRGGKNSALPGGGPCLVCNEPLGAGQRFEDFVDSWYHFDCRHGFMAGHSAAQQILDALARLDGGRRLTFLIRLLSKFGRM